MKKPQASAKLLNLPEEQQAALAEWLLGGMAYHEARALVAKEYGVTTSLAALSHFYQEVCVPALIARRRRAVSVADEVAKEADAEPGKWDAATVDAIKQRAFDLAIAPTSRPGDVKALFMLLQKARDQELKAMSLGIEREKLELLKRKAEQAEATEAVVKSDLTPEEKQRRIKEVFGLA